MSDGLAPRDLVSPEADLNLMISCPMFVALRTFLAWEVQYQVMQSPSLRGAKLSDNPFEDPLADFDRSVNRTLDGIGALEDLEFLLTIKASQTPAESEHLLALAVPDQAADIERHYLRVASAVDEDSAAGREIQANIARIDDVPIHSFAWPQVRADGTRQTEYFAISSGMLYAANNVSGQTAIAAALSPPDDGSSDHTEHSAVLMSGRAVQYRPCCVTGLEMNRKSWRLSMLKAEVVDSHSHFSRASMSCSHPL